MSRELKDKVALITGSTDGIGHETAKLFAAEGAEVIVSGRDAERGQAVVEEICGEGGKARFVQADLIDLDAVHGLARQAGDVDILINNAATAMMAPTLSQQVAAFDESFAVNVRAPYFLTAALAPAMIARGSRQHRQRFDDGSECRHAWNVRLQRDQSGPQLVDAHVGGRVRRRRSSHHHCRAGADANTEGDQLHGRGARQRDRLDDVARAAGFDTGNRRSRAVPRQRPLQLHDRRASGCRRRPHRDLRTERLNPSHFQRLNF